MAQTPNAKRASAQNDFRLAIADSSVVVLGISVLGLGLGVILSAHGLPFWTAPLLSGLVFAGSVGSLYALRSVKSLSVCARLKITPAAVSQCIGGLGRPSREKEVGNKI